MKNLIVVFTPLQFLNAIQYIKEFGQSFKLVVLTNSKINIDQIKKIDHERIAVFPLENFGFLEANILWFIKMIYVRMISLRRYDQVIIGNYNNIAGYYTGLRFNEKSKNVVLLDDGLATFNIYTDRNIHHKLHNSRVFGGKGVPIYRHFFGIKKSKVIPSLKFYTLYDLTSIAPPRYDDIHTFAIRSDSTELDENLVWFIGSPLVALNIIDKDAFVKIINKVKESCDEKKKQFVYVLHRFEQPFDEINIDYIKFDKPLEQVFLNHNDRLPKTIISFYSTALLNVVSFLPNISGYYIDITNFDYVSRGNIQEVYDYFRSVPGLEEYNLTNIK